MMQEKVSRIAKRKDEHIDINLEQDVDFDQTTGFENYRFEHNAIPEIDLDNISTSTFFLGKKVALPLVISSMTGGTERAREINEKLARAAERHQIAIALGSQRAMIEDPTSIPTYQIREFAPGVPIIGNIGAVQLNYGISVDDCQKMVDLNQADGFYIHFNPIQEAVQEGGDTNWSGLLNKISKLCSKLSVPVLAKEVGFGFSSKTIRQLLECGVSAIDVAGAGGTSWAKVEKYRQSSNLNQELAESFSNWGIPTSDAIHNVRNIDQNIPLIASGGIRDGIDIAKSIALGADLAGMAGPFLKAANVSDQKIDEQIQLIQGQLKIAMFATGNPDLSALKSEKLLRTKI